MGSLIPPPSGEKRQRQETETEQGSSKVRSWTSISFWEAPPIGVQGGLITPAGICGMYKTKLFAPAGTLVHSHRRQCKQAWLML
eukprot:740730-Pelagomonas_calceolata.AAC.1